VVAHRVLNGLLRLQAIPRDGDHDRFILVKYAPFQKFQHAGHRHSACCFGKYPLRAA